MNTWKRTICLAIIGCCALGVSATPASAYLDPGSGSFIFQMVIGAILGGAFTLKIYFKKISLFFTRLFNKKEEEKKDGEQE